MLKIRGMSIVKNFFTGVNRFGHGLTSRIMIGAERDVSWMRLLEPLPRAAPRMHQEAA